MVAMLFILFDVEAVFMLPWAVIYSDLPKITGSRLFGFGKLSSISALSPLACFMSQRRGFSDWSTDRADL